MICCYNQHENDLFPENLLGMKIKLSKSGDAEIIPQDSKDVQKYKEKHESAHEQPKRTESPIGTYLWFNFKYQLYTDICMKKIIFRCENQVIQKWRCFNNST